MNGDELTATQMQARFAEFPRQIQQLGTQNPLVRRIMECYAHGEFITREEAYCQMIVGLSKNWESIRKDYERVMLTSMIPQATWRKSE